MQFKLTLLKNSEFRESLCAVSWNSSDEIFYCGDDRFLAKWNLTSRDSNKVCDFLENVYPVDLHCFLRVASGVKKNYIEQILLTSTDGKFHIISNSGRIEKSVEAHRGAVLVGRWNHDGTGIVTGGEDGQIKIWSRSGMQRSTIAQEGFPIYSAAWSPDSSQILYTNDKMLVMKPLSTNVKANRWKAHDGLILKVSWNRNNNLIISGGEDCRYKVWDSYGRQLYASVVHEYPVTSLSWSPTGDYFAIGSFNTIRLCDKSGWSYCLQKPNTGSIYCIDWSIDGTQLAGACANRNLLVGHIIGRSYDWLNYEISLISRKCLEVKDIVTDVVDKLEFSERVVQVAVGYKHLVVTTPAQCYIYDTSNFNTPNILELKEGSVSVLQLAKKHFLLVESSLVSVYGYDGRHSYSPKWPNMIFDGISKNIMSLSNEILAIRDQLDDKMMYFIELGASSTSPSFTHTVGITDLALNQAGSSISDRHLAFIDKNKDFYIVAVEQKLNVMRKIEKLAVMTHSMLWNSDSNILTAMQETTITVWYYPAIAFFDRRLLRRSVLIKNKNEFGRNPSIINFSGSHVSIRRSDGCVIDFCISPMIEILHNYASASRWQECLKLCRCAKDELLWACLAGLALEKRDLVTSEEAYAAIDMFDKVSYINYIRLLKDPTLQISEKALLLGNVEEAESALLQKGYIYRAIHLNIRMHYWERALNIAIKHKSHIDTVLSYRKKHLESLEKPEMNKKFLEFKDIADPQKGLNQDPRIQEAITDLPNSAFSNNCEDSAYQKLAFFKKNDLRGTCMYLYS